MSRKLINRTFFAAAFVILVGASVSVSEAGSSKALPVGTVAFRIENFVRALETSGVEAQARYYQFRGMNLATTDGHHASRGCHFSVT